MSEVKVSTGLVPSKAGRENLFPSFWWLAGYLWHSLEMVFPLCLYIIFPLYISLCLHMAFFL